MNKNKEIFETMPVPKALADGKDVIVSNFGVSDSGTRFGADTNGDGPLTLVDILHVLKQALK